MIAGAVITVSLIALVPALTLKPSSDGGISDPGGSRHTENTDRPSDSDNILNEDNLGEWS